MPFANVEMVTAPLRCEQCGHLQTSPPFAHYGLGPVRIGVDCDVCGGPAMTIGRYGSVERDGQVLTVLRDASEIELRDIAAALEALDAIDLEEAAQKIEALDTDAARGVAAWIRENGGWFAAVSAAGTALSAVLMLVSLLLQHADQSDSQPIHIDKLVIHYDGVVTQTDDPPPTSQTAPEPSP